MFSAIRCISINCLDKHMDGWIFMFSLLSNNGEVDPLNRETLHSPWVVLKNIAKTLMIVEMTSQFSQHTVPF